MRSKRAHRMFLVAAAHLTVLTSFALAQPLFDLLGRNPEFFVAHDSTRAEIVGFALLVTFAVPLCVLLVEAGANVVHSAAGSAVHLAAIGFLAAVVILHAAVNQTQMESTVLMPLAAFGGGLSALAYHYLGAVRSFLTLLSPAPLVFLGLFLFHGPIANLVLSQGSVQAETVVQARTPVVLVIFDEFPVLSLMDEREQIDRVRYPNFAALAADSMWFRNATAVGDYTAFAAPAILGGVYPKHSQLPIAADYPRTVFTLLGKSYEITAFMPFGQLCPRGVCRGDVTTEKERAQSLLSDISVAYGHLVLPEDLRQKLPPVEGTWGDFRGAEVKGRTKPQGPISHAGGKKGLHIALEASLDARSRSVAAFLDSLKPSSRPTLHLLHPLYPHRPFERVPSGKYYKTERWMDGMKLGTVMWQDNEFLVRQAWERHLLQVAFTDRVVGEIVERLKQVRMYDRALVIITADHGASFWPGHSFRRLDATTMPDILYVPLFVKLPDQELGGKIVDRPVAMVDVLPTIVDVLGIRTPWHFDGRSLLEGGTDRVRVLGKNGTVWTVPTGRLTALRREHAARKFEIFAKGNEKPGLFGVGPNSELVGRSASEFRSAAPEGVNAKLDQPNEIRFVDPDSAYVPAMIRGTVDRGSSGGALDLAISLNGRIVAVAETFRRDEEDRDRFSFVVPESAFQPGANEARIYWVRNTTELLTLAQIACVGCD